MKQTLLCLLVCCVMSCTKEKLTNSIVGKWKMESAYNCTGDSTVNVPDAFMQFSANGEFSMDTLSNQFTYKLFCKNFDRYLVQSDGIIKLYQHSGQESFSIYHSDHQVLIAYRSNGEKFIRSY